MVVMAAPFVHSYSWPDFGLSLSVLIAASKAPQLLRNSHGGQ